MTYDRGRRMSAHAQLTARTGAVVYFADPHSPLAARQQREHQRAAAPKYLPKGTDLSVHSAADLEAIAYKLNSAPAQGAGLCTPLEVYADLPAPYQCGLRSAGGYCCHLDLETARHDRRQSRMQSCRGTLIGVQGSMSV